MTAAWSPVPRLLREWSAGELRQHPWRAAAALVAVMLGVALAWTVHLIHASALAEFTQAVRSVNGQPDLELRAAAGRFDDALFEQVAAHPMVDTASPVLEAASYVLRDGAGQLPVRLPVRVLGVDALSVAGIAPALLPVSADGQSRFSPFQPDSVFLNPAAAAALGPAGAAGRTLQLQTGASTRTLRVAGSVSAPGAALLVMDIAAAQDLLGMAGQISRIDLRLRPGADRDALVRELPLGTDVLPVAPGDDAQRVSNLSRAYRVNLTVLALVALFTGGFLVFSVLSLSVAQRARQIALLGVLGLTGRERMAVVVAESAVLGVAGSALGIALGTGLAATALRLLGGDLGGGYFAGVQPALHWSTGWAAAYAALGVAAAVAGGWQPARVAATLPPAIALKGLDVRASHDTDLSMRGDPGLWIAITLVALGVVAATLPPVGDVPLAAYAAVALLLLGGILGMPAGVALLYGPAVAWLGRSLHSGPQQAHGRAGPLVLALLALERARRQRAVAVVALSGVVASLALSVALTVMVGSFRTSVTRWLDVVLPAELYVRVAASTAAADSAWLPPQFVDAVGQVPGVQRVGTLRHRLLVIDPARPPVTLIARALDTPTQALALTGPAVTPPPGAIPIWVSEATAEIYDARPGEVFHRMPGLSAAAAPAPSYFVSGVWRDYGRQHGAIAIDARDYIRITGDERVNDLAIWLTPQADADAVRARIRQLAQAGQAGAAGDSALIEFASATQIRDTSLRIFDRSFAVTYWLQAVAIGMGLFGVAASFSAQVLARRKEFGLLTHLGLTRRQTLSLVAGEGLAWSLIGAIAGAALGVAVSVVLVHVVNPQSFHWTMDLVVPAGRVLALCAAVVAAGTLTAWAAGRAAASQDAVLAVREDW